MLGLLNRDFVETIIPRKPGEIYQVIAVEPSGPERGPKEVTANSWPLLSAHPGLRSRRGCHHLKDLAKKRPEGTAAETVRLVPAWPDGTGRNETAAPPGRPAA